jgi:hypothetical protein
MPIVAPASLNLIRKAAYHYYPEGPDHVATLNPKPQVARIAVVRRFDPCPLRVLA